MRLRLVNVGATAAINGKDKIFGYLICTVCGDSLSPLSTDKAWERFQQSHKDRYGRDVTIVGLHADVVADTLSLPACVNSQTAYSVLEALCIAATRVLDMHREDLQILVIGHVDRDEVDALLWDPMPGGSGLLEQICARFGEIAAIAWEVVSHCPAVCEVSCIDCLQTFRNGYYHKCLDRTLAEERLKACAGAFSDPQRVDEGDMESVEVDGRRLKQGMFVAQAVGKSMEPDIPDGAFCLFSAPAAGSRQGRTVLVQLRDQVDPESGERYTVKKYSSEKSASSDGTVQVVAELVAVLG